ARLLASEADPVAALKAYEETRQPVTARIVLQNRTAPPNVIVDTVEQRTGGKKFEKLEDIISQDEMKAIFERYQKVAGYHVQQVSRPQGYRDHGRYRAVTEAHLRGSGQAPRRRRCQGEGYERAAMHLHRRHRRTSADHGAHGRRLRAVGRHRAAQGADRGGLR